MFPLSLLIAIIATLLLLPKIVVIHFVNSNLWEKIGLGDSIVLLLQDFSVAIAVFLGLHWILATKTKQNLTRWINFALVVCGLLLLILMFDARTRELWLKPLDLGMVAYGISNMDDLRSGTEIFFNHVAAWGMTFRRLLAFVGVTFLVVAAAINLLIRTRIPSKSESSAESENKVEAKTISRRYLYALSSVPTLLLISALCDNARYRLESNIYTLTLVDLVEQHHSSEELEQLAKAFEQPLQPLSDVLTGSNSPHKKYPVNEIRDQFKNLLVIFYESVRWYDVNLDDSDNPYPNLSKLAAEGSFAKAYVAVPHSSKAYFTVLSGRYPYLGIEMRELLANPQPSILHELKRQKGIKTFAFSSMPLSFENVDGMLGAMGVDNRLQTDQLLREKGQELQSQSSFGSDDAPLYRLAAEYLADQSSPYAALLFPVAAHYPYSCPGLENSDKGHANYLNCLTYSDKLLEDMLKEFSSHGLLDNTLLVIVGDHGEGFGEHGVFMHNSSVYEEEVTIPLVLWSPNKQLNWGRLPNLRQIDIAPSLADLFGLQGNLEVQGRSVFSEGPTPAIYLSTFFDDSTYGLIEYPHKYVYEWSPKRLTHFDLQRDPQENAGQIIESGEIREQMIQRMLSFRAYQRQAFGPQ